MTLAAGFLAGLATGLTAVCRLGRAAAAAAAAAVVAGFVPHSDARYVAYRHPTPSTACR